eukprot:UN30643
MFEDNPACAEISTECRDALWECTVCDDDQMDVDDECVCSDVDLGCAETEVASDTDNNGCVDTCVDPNYCFLGEGVCRATNGDAPPNYSANNISVEVCRDICTSYSKCIGFSMSRRSRCALWFEEDVVNPPSYLGHVFEWHDDLEWDIGTDFITKGEGSASWEWECYAKRDECEREDVCDVVANMEQEKTDLEGEISLLEERKMYCETDTNIASDAFTECIS